MKNSDFNLIEALKYLIKDKEFLNTFLDLGDGNQETGQKKLIDLLTKATTNQLSDLEKEEVEMLNMAINDVKNKSKDPTTQNTLLLISQALHKAITTPKKAKGTTPAIRITTGSTPNLIIGNQKTTENNKKLHKNLR